jgi:DNA-binding beta-propeller fold protein YncE
MLNAGVVLGFSFDSSGALTPLSGSPFTVGSQPNSVTIDPSEKFLFSADFSGDVSSFTIDPSTGALTAVAGSPFPVSENPFQVAVNASASLLIVSCANESTIPAFTIDSAGVLTAAAPLDGGGTSGGVAIVHKSS